jgi:hypothetical protein
LVNKGLKYVLVDISSLVGDISIVQCPRKFLIAFSIACDPI